MVSTLDRPRETTPAPQPKLGISNREVRPWEETEIIITGGCNGSGFALAERLLTTTPIKRVHLGTRYEENFDLAVRRLKKTHPDTNLEPPRIRMFQADICQPDEVITAFRSIRSSGGRVTDVAHAAAGGMEKMFLDKARRERLVTAAKEVKQKGEGIDLSEISADLEQAAMAERAYGWDVNYHGPRKFVEYLAGQLPDGGMFGNIPSTWSATLTNVPRFYEIAVAEPKNEFSSLLASLGPQFRSAGLGSYETISQLIRDSKAGRSLNLLILPLLDPQLREQALSYSVASADVARAQHRTLESDPRNWEALPHRSWVYTDNNTLQITDRMDMNHPMFNLRLGL
jgi:NAD(P)-dependent dehydrogenase (short-subunit alcohol dehydrogenase family)